MGKPYAEELQALPSTYRWAMAQDVAPLADAVSACGGLPLVAVGSGGSLTAAHFAALLHQVHLGSLGKAVTPLEVIQALPRLKYQNVLFITSGGANADVIAAFRQAVVREPAKLVILCGQKDSPLSRLARAYRYVDLFEFDLPSGRDGFLATNSLLAFQVLLARAFGATSATPALLPRTLGRLVHPGVPLRNFRSRLRAGCSPLWQRDHLIVLYGPRTQSVAADLESKFTEAALGVVQPADYRNFAHGRHHWLAKRGAATAVLAVISDEDRELAVRTLRLIPPGVPVVQIDTRQGGSAAAVAGLVSGFHVAGLAGEARGIDPGRPGVPAFGRALYNLRVPTPPATPDGLSPSAAAAIERKAGPSIARLESFGGLPEWESAYRAFVARLSRAVFGAVVLDYDGTLCDTRDRFCGLGAEVARELVRLLRGGAVIGVATGRGKSVREDLRSAVPRSLWPSVIVGYYNGSEIASLTDAKRPTRGAPLDQLAGIAQALQSDTALARLVTLDCRPRQISVVPKPGTSGDAVWDILHRVTTAPGAAGVSLVRSGHSVDVLAPGVTKKALVDHVRARLVPGDPAILCIGDRGRWPGNDFVLLAEDHALSVDEVSPDPRTCWNLAPPGVRGAQACLHYLKLLVADGRRGSFRVLPRRSGGRRGGS